MKYSYDFAVIEGKIPMIEFLDGLSVRERAKVFANIDKLIELKELGIQPKENLSKAVGYGIFELRVHFESRIARSFYFYENKRRIIFTHGFIKKTDRTPKQEIERAKRIAGEWREIT